jgi:hypothetical protein
MKRIAAGLAASVLAASATVFGFAGPALAVSPTCTATAEKPFIDGENVFGYGDINCTAKASFTITAKLWRNNGDGTYKSWSGTYADQVASWETRPAATYCAGGTGVRQWHTESIISWKIYSGSSVEASGNSYNNSPDVNLDCH